MQPRAPIFLHVGLMKTGTSYLQSIFWNSQDELRQQGLDLVPPSKLDTFHLMLDVRDRYLPDADPPSVAQALARLPGQLARLQGTRALVSQESLASATPEQVARMVSEFKGHELHVVVTVRDIARQLPSAWQQAIQSGRSVPFERYVDSVVSGNGRPAKAFWRTQGVLDVLARWETAIPRERIHVVTVPLAGDDQGLLLERYCRLFAVDPAALRTDVARSNTSLGRVQAELLRRVNAELPDHARRRDKYGDVGKRFFAVGVLGQQERERSLLPRTYQAWCREHAASVIEGIKAGGYDVVGDLADLEPSEASFTDDEQVVSEAEVAAAAAQAISALLEQRMAWAQRRRGAGGRGGRAGGSPARARVRSLIGRARRRVTRS